MSDLFSKFLKSNRTLIKPKQPGLGEMNRSLKTTTSNIPASIPTVPKSSHFEPDAGVLKYSDVMSPLPSADNIFTVGNVGTPDPKDLRQASYVNNNYAGDDYVD